MSAFCGSDQFVELHLDCFSVSILGVLNQKDHQERDDRSASVDGQLPRIAEAEQRTCDAPGNDDTDSQREYSGATAEVCRRLRKLRVPASAMHGSPQGL